MKILSLVGKYFLASSTFGGTYAYFENRKECQPPGIFIPVIITAGLSPFVPFLYLYEKISAKKLDFFKIKIDFIF